MAITISISLQKGGTGKTTTAETIAAILGSKGKKVLLVDMDAQMNSTFISGVNVKKSITDLFIGDAGISEVIYKAEHYDLLAADEYLANLERAAHVEPTLLTDTLAPVQKQYDFILIDTPPALGNLLKNCLLASDYVLIPTDARPLSIKGLDALEPTLNAVHDVSWRFKVLGIVLVKYNERTILNRQIRELLEDRAAAMNTILFDTKIREGVAVPESQAMQKSLIDYAPHSNPCIDYIRLTDEILARIEKR